MSGRHGAQSLDTRLGIRRPAPAPVGKRSKLPGPGGELDQAGRVGMDRCQPAGNMPNDQHSGSWFELPCWSDVVDLTWHNPNPLIMVEGPEIVIRPVGIRRLPSDMRMATATTVMRDGYR